MVKLPESFGSSFESDDEDSEKKKRSAPGIGAFARSTLEQGRRNLHEEEDEEKEKKKKAKRESEKDEKKKESEQTTENPKEVERGERKSETQKAREPSEEQSSEDYEESTDIESAKREILREQLQAETIELQSSVESTQPGSVEHAEAAALLAVTQRLNQKLENPDAETDPVIDAEFDKRMEEIQVENEILDDETEIQDTPVPNTPLVTPNTVLSPTNTTTPNPVMASPPRPLVSSAPASPTNPPTPPPVAPPSIQTPSGGPGIGGAHFNAQPVQHNPNTAVPRPSAEVIRTRDPSDLLLGGVIGYMVGRRGGRKRTERRLQPEINRLQTEVEQTKRHLAGREDELRKVAGNQVRSQSREKVTVKREIAPSEQKRTPISEILRQTVLVPEQIKKMPGVKVESKPTPASEVQVKKVEHMNTQEILKVANSIVIEGVSVRRLYETNKIDRNGLIQIVQEGMRGKDVKKAYEKVELGRERQRERAREFRHDDPSFTADTSDDSTSNPVQKTVNSPISPLIVPTNLDLKSVQPLNQHADLNIAHEQPVQERKQEKPESKQTYFAAGAILAIGLGLILVWFLFSL